MVGVCTDSHVTVRTMLMKSASLKVTIPYSMVMASDMTILSLKGIKFPIICDRDGDFSRAFGVLKLSDGNFGAARAVLFCFKTFSPTGFCHTGGSARPREEAGPLEVAQRAHSCQVSDYWRCHQEFLNCVHRPESFLQLLSRLQGNASSAKKPASFVSKAPTVSFADSDAARKNDSVDDQSSKSATLKPADLEVEETEKVANKTAKSPASHKSAPAVLQPRNVQAGAGVKSAEMEPSNRSNGTQSKPSSNTPSKNLADSTKEEAKATDTPNLQPSGLKEENLEETEKAASLFHADQQEPTKEPKALLGSEASRTPTPFGSVSRPGSNRTPMTFETVDKSLEKPPKTTKPGSAVETAKADVKKKPAASSNL